MVAGGMQQRPAARRLDEQASRGRGGCFLVNSNFHPDVADCAVMSAQTDPLRRKALAIIREGRLTVLGAACRLGRSGEKDAVVDTLTVRVQSLRFGFNPYIVDLLYGRWTCTCIAVGLCKHIRASQLITGHASARKDTT